MNKGEASVSKRLTNMLYRSNSAEARRSQFVANNSHHWQSEKGKPREFYEAEALKRFPDDYNP